MTNTEIKTSRVSEGGIFFFFDRPLQALLILSTLLQNQSRLNAGKNAVVRVSPDSFPQNRC